MRSAIPRSVTRALALVLAPTLHGVLPVAVARAGAGGDGGMTADVSATEGAGEDEGAGGGTHATGGDIEDPGAEEPFPLDVERSAVEAPDGRREPTGLAPAGPISRRVLVDGTTVAHLVAVDLAHPDVKGIVGTPERLRGAVTSAFARETGVVAAVNGDFYDGRLQPLGLTITSGRPWPRSADTAGWSFLACDAAKRCTIDTSRSARAIDPAWTTVVGGRDVLLDGERAWGPADDVACGSLCVDPHPRTTVGLSRDGRTLFLYLIEGRRPGVVGLALSKVASRLRALGAWTALNLDGGYSSELVWDGAVATGRPTRMPQERPVANHLGVLVIRPR